MLTTSAQKCPELLSNFLDKLQRTKTSYPGKLNSRIVLNTYKDYVTLYDNPPDGCDTLKYLLKNEIEINADLSHRIMRQDDSFAF